MRATHQARFAVRLGVRLGAAAVAMATLAGCQSIDVNSSNAAQIRVVNASPNAGGLDFYDNKVAVAYNLGFQTQTSYVATNPGTQTITADAAGATPPQVLTSATASLGSQKNYTVLVGNVYANLQETILLDQNFPAPTGQIAVRFLDQATAVGAVDIYLIPSGGKLTTTLPFLTDINFGTNTGYIDIPSGTYAIAVVPTGTVPVSTTVTLLTGAQVGYAAGAVRTVVLTDVQLTSTPAVYPVILDDYDSPSSTG
jgi:hypothetical protein